MFIAIWAKHDEANTASVAAMIHFTGDLPHRG